MKNIQLSSIDNWDVNSDSRYNSPLTEWYSKIRNLNISDFEIGDLCVCMRQGLYLQYTVPKALSSLKNELLAGDQFDGELALSIISIDSEFWNRYPTEKAELISILRESLGDYDYETSSDIRRFLVAI